LAYKITGRDHPKSGVCKSVKTSMQSHSLQQHVFWFLFPPFIIITNITWPILGFVFLEKILEMQMHLRLKHLGKQID